MEFAKKFITEKAEKLNGKTAMLGIFALIGIYYFKGTNSSRYFLNKAIF